MEQTWDRVWKELWKIYGEHSRTLNPNTMHNLLPQLSKLGYALVMSSSWYFLSWAEPSLRVPSRADKFSVLFKNHNQTSQFPKYLDYNQFHGHFFDSSFQLRVQNWYWKPKIGDAEFLVYFNRPTNGEWSKLNKSTRFIRVFIVLRIYKFD